MKKEFTYPFLLLKSVLYTAEYQLLLLLSGLSPKNFTPPKREKDPKILKYLLENIKKIHLQDASNIEKGYYPAKVLLHESPVKHLTRLPYLLWDSLKISRRRKKGQTKDFNEKEINLKEKLPQYFKRNFHFQTNGYLSKVSAELYDHQVEILFSGTAGAMRRMLIKEIIDFKKIKNKKLRILEIAAGTGSASLDFIYAFPNSEYYLTDLSTAYLEVAKLRLKNKNIHFEVANAANLPYQDNSFDIVFSIFLFHELPNKVRLETFAEMFRVCKKNGVLGLCDSLQLNDEPILNKVLKEFPKNYHEPFYTNYIKNPIEKMVESAGWAQVKSQNYLLSKTVLGTK